MRACARHDSIKSAIRRTIISLHRRRVFSRQKTPLFLSREYWGDNFVEGFARVIARSREVSGILGQSIAWQVFPPRFAYINIDVHIFILHFGTSHIFRLFLPYFYNMLLEIDK